MTKINLLTLNKMKRSGICTPLLAKVMTHYDLYLTTDFCIINVLVINFVINILPKEQSFSCLTFYLSKLLSVIANFGLLRS